MSFRVLVLYIAAPAIIFMLALGGLVIAASTVWLHTPPSHDMRALEPLSDKR